VCLVELGTPYFLLTVFPSIFWMAPDLSLQNAGPFAFRRALGGKMLDFLVGTRSGGAVSLQVYGAEGVELIARCVYGVARVFRAVADGDVGGRAAGSLRCVA
jgi:hypothetical protein